MLFEQNVVDVINAINNNTETRFSAAITGGGSLFLSNWAINPGASKSLIQGIIPYSSVTFDNFVGRKPERYCSSEAARLLASTAYRLAILHGGNMGVGCSSVLTTDKPHKGDHRIHIAIQTKQVTHCHSYILDKGLRTRLEEEVLAAKLILYNVAKFSGLDIDKSFEYLNIQMTGNEIVHASVSSVAAPSRWRSLFHNETKISIEGGIPFDSSHVIYPGSFNPLHDGHKEIASLVKERTGKSVFYEIAISNSEITKPPLDYVDIWNRYNQFSQNDDSLLLTNCPTFVEKCRALGKNLTFVVGIDTASRIVGSKYHRHLYQGTDAEIDEQSVNELRDNNVKFLVTPRNYKGQLATLDNPGNHIIDSRILPLCQEFKTSLKFVDSSSTSIRQAKGELYPPIMIGNVQ